MPLRVGETGAAQRVENRLRRDARTDRVPVVVHQLLGLGVPAPEAREERDDGAEVEAEDGVAGAGAGRRDLEDQHAAVRTKHPKQLREEAAEIGEEGQSETDTQ